MKEPHVLEVLWQNPLSYEHIMQQIFLYLDSSTIRSLKCSNSEMRNYVQRLLWQNSKAQKCLTNKLKNSWLTRQNTEESAFQCSDDVYDMKILHDVIICGLRNGTIEIWNKKTLKKELSLEDQHGSVQVDGNDDIIVGVSSDSTICVWNRKTGDLREVFYIHRASVWGVRIQDNCIVTGSMDGTIAVIDAETLVIKKHFVAHENEWGISDLDTSSDVIVSGCFDRILRVWSFPDCEHLRTIDAKHAVNCVSVCKELVATCSRTGKTAGQPNVIIWNVYTGDMVRSLDLSSACFVKLDKDKLVALVAAGDTIIGTHHMVKWPIAKVLILYRPDDLQSSDSNLNKPSKTTSKTTSNGKWDIRDGKNKTEILLRYQQTPTVISSRTFLVYSQPRTPGMCSVLDFWP